MKRKILFLYYTQFGYHTDLFMYGKYLDKTKYEIQYFCFDQKLPKIEIENIRVHYQTLNSERVANYLKYFYRLKMLIRTEKYDLVFHVDGQFTLLIRLLNLRQPMLLDIRSGDLLL